MRGLFVVVALALHAAPSFAGAPEFVATGVLAAGAIASVREIRVASFRVRACDVVDGLSPEAAGVDLGPAPALGGTRIIDRDEIVRALRAHDIDDPGNVPASVRVLRRARTLQPADVDRLVRETLGSKLPRGVALSAVHPGRPLDVPDGWTRATVDVPRPPRRTGPLASTASVVFFEDAQALVRVAVPVDLTLSEEAAIPDLQHGARVTLVVRRGLVEVTSSATAGADADVGAVLPVVLHPAGRIVRARLEDLEHAVMLDVP
jgi:hypothetical protein